MIHHGRISSDSKMKGSSSNVRQRHSVDWHLIESGRGAFDCTSCQYHIIVFLTYMVPSVFCYSLYYYMCLHGSHCAELIIILIRYYEVHTLAAKTAILWLHLLLCYYCEQNIVFVRYHHPICHRNIRALRFITHTRRVDYAAYGCKSVLHSYPRMYQSSQLCLEALIGPLLIITLSVILEYIY